MKVDVSIVVCVRVEHNIPKHLHPDDGVDEEQHPNQEDYIRQRLEGLYEGPQQYSDGVALA